MLLAFGVSALAGWQLLTMRNDVIEITNASGANVLLIIERELNRDLDMHAQSLQTIINVIKSPSGLDNSLGLAALVYGHVAGSPGMGTIILTDKYGQLLQDLNHDGETQQDLSTREYFQVHAKGDHSIHLSHPFRPSYNSSMRVISLSRPLIDQNGKFDGVVAAITNIRSLEGYAEDLKISRDDTISIHLLDGTLLAQWPDNAPARTREETRAFQNFIRSGRAKFINDATNTARPYWQGYRRVGNYPAVVTIERARRTVLQTWLARSVITIIFLIAFNLATVVLAYRLTSHLRRQKNAESRLRAEANTDALTGLYNRRWFDELIRKEWHRHLRNNQNLAVLMLDIDQFKAYNDHYGHQMGDKALIKVANQVRTAAQRDEDGSARYGGEEFVVVLPNCDLTGALVVAEAIRQGVESAGLPHAKGDRGIVTISVGVASTSSNKVESVEALVKRADEMLYEAKLGGRNRVEPH